MPMVIPLVAAGASIYAGITATTALVSGLMIAGGALTAVGTLTKNPKLAKIGGVLSLAGGVTGLVAGSWASTASSLAGEAGMGDLAANASQIAGGAGDAAANASQIALGAGDAAANASQIVGAGGDIAGNSAMQTGLLQSQSPTYLDAMATSGNPAMTAPSAAGMPSSVPASELASPSPTSQAWANGSPGLGQDQVSAVGGAAQGPAVPPGSTTIGKVAGWMKDNANLVNAGSGLLAGAAKSAGEADLLKQKWAEEDKAIARRRAQISASMIGLRMPTYVAPTKG